MNDELYRQIVMAQGDVIQEVYSVAEGRYTGVVVYNETKGTARDLRRTGRTVQSVTQMGAANYSNPNINPMEKVRQAVSGRR